MTRVKRGTISNKTRRNVLKQVKGYRFGRSNKERQAREAIAHAGEHAFAHRKDKKNDFRRLWQIRLGASLKNFDISYSKAIGAMKKKNIDLNRKVLSEIASENPESFGRIIEKIKS